MNIKLTNVSIAYEVFGKGKPLILLHGNMEDRHIFDPLIDSIKDTYKIYAVDSRNHGKSSKHTVFSYDDMSQDLHEFITKLKIDKPSILGFSDGGIIALKLAIKAPHIISKLILCGVNYNTKGLIKKVYKAMHAKYKKDGSPYIRLMLNEPNIVKKDLKQIDHKTLITVGEFDVIKASHTQKLHQLLKNSELIILKGKNHNNYITNVDDLKDLIKDFI